jgi:hypothetical protein
MIQQRTLEYAVKSNTTDEIHTLWTTDYVDHVNACADLIAKGNLVHVTQREVTYSPSSKARMRVDAEPIEVSLFEQLNGMEELDQLDDALIKKIAQKLSINALPLFTEGLAQAILTEAREMYTYDDNTIINDKLDKAESFVSWLRSVGGVGGWSNTAGSLEVHGFYKGPHIGDADVEDDEVDTSTEE